jgi:hypothetical protein
MHGKSNFEVNKSIDLVISIKNIDFLDELGFFVGEK